MSLPLHERRKITFAEYGALLGTRAMLVMKALTHTKKRDVKPHKHQFNMAVQCKLDECGSVGCIGGTMALIMGKSEIDAKYYVGTCNHIGTASKSFQELFFPPPIRDLRVNWEDITPAQSVVAIDNWLKTGKPNWKKAIKSA
jgi:hypothetical protein